MSIRPEDYLFTDFSAGQLSAKLAGRFDLPVNAKGVAKAENCIPLSPCGIGFRSGTRRVVTLDSGKSGWISWRVSSTVTYLVEITSTTIRFYRDDEYRATVTPGGTLSAADIASVGFAQSPGRLYLVLGTGIWAPRVLTYTALDTITLANLAIMGNTGKVPFQSSGNYPRRVGIADGCLVFASSINEPQKEWRSRPGIFYYEPWNEETEYEIGDLRTARDATKLAIYQCTTAGKSGTTEPTWPSSGTVTDGTVVWTYSSAYNVDFTEYEEITTTTTRERNPNLSFSGDTTSGSQTISGIDPEIIKKLKVGDMLRGAGIPGRAELSTAAAYSYTDYGSHWTKKDNKLYGAATAGSAWLLGLSSSFTSLLKVGEPITGDAIPASTILEIAATSIRISHNAILTDEAATFSVGRIAAYIETIGATSIGFQVLAELGELDPVELSLSASATASDAALVAGWHDPLIPEIENITDTERIVNANQAFSANIATGQLDEILWLAGGRDLVLGTTSGEHIQPAGTTAHAIMAPRNTAYGSAAVQPVAIGDEIMFVEANQKGIRSYIFSQERDGYLSPPLSASADGIFSGKIIKLAYQASPLPILWALMDDGNLVGCTYVPALGITGWFTYTAGGSGFIEDIVVIPVSGVDTLYLEVLRGTVRTLERQIAVETPGEHLDASYSGTVASGQVTGLTWLASADVTIYHGGTAYPVTVSAAGVATMPAAIADGQTVLIGYGYEGIITLLPPNPRGKYMKQKTTFSLIARVLSSYAFKTEPWEDADDGYVNEVQLESEPFTGDAPVPVSGNWGEGSVTILQDRPVDMTIIAITASVDGGD